MKQYSFEEYEGVFVEVSELRELLEKRKTYYKTQGWDALREEMEELLTDLQDAPANFGSVTPKKLDEEKEARKVMVCSQCGAIDESYTAYCGKCGRSPHHLEEEKVTRK